VVVGERLPEVAYLAARHRLHLAEQLAPKRRRPLRGGELAFKVTNALDALADLLEQRGRVRHPRDGRGEPLLLRS
jgi:hypothetical protein